MGVSRNLKQKIESLSKEDVDRMVRMGWEDRTTFEAIKIQFAFSENEFVRFMRTQLEAEAFSRWRKRIHNQGRLKHQAKRGFAVARFKCSRQSVDGITKGWK
jgi:uncharacterized protein (TIGR03643 family)